MWTFLLILVIVFAAVDLLIKFVVDPLASKKRKRDRVVNNNEEINEHCIGLVGATMYDGGKSKDAGESNNKTCDGKNRNGNNSDK
ncbi:MAG: hypothetical protein ABR980_03515 [Ignavibacteriaceae bacterium]|jgi:hypothetical protein